MRIVASNEESISLAATLLKSGSLVGMPTETVYGIAANALDPQAVRATFSVKGRPSENPLIVHIASIEQVEEVAEQIPPEALILAGRFWPGPLTLVLPKSVIVSAEITGGLPTVAVRMPAHPVARRLIELAGVPLTAPSANLFMGLSPTTAQSIDPAVADKLAMILDGGPCNVGIESTVLDLTDAGPAILRPGAVTQQMVEEALGRLILGAPIAAERKSPGQYTRHYAPSTPLRIVECIEGDQPGLAITTAGSRQIVMPGNAEDYARNLYKSLWEMDRAGFDVIYVEAPPKAPEWAAVWDRLLKASNGSKA